jgi:F-type H+-transporting ATPase subunit b
MMFLAAAGEPLWMNPTFWVGVAFVILLGMMVRAKVISTITTALDDRAAGIKSEIEEAKRLREEAERLLADYQKKHADAENEAKAIVENARREAEALAAETRRSLKEGLERRTKVAEDKIARAEAQAVSDVRATAVDVAMAAAETLLAAKSAGQPGAAMIDQSIRDLKGRLN